MIRSIGAAKQSILAIDRLFISRSWSGIDLRMIPKYLKVKLLMEVETIKHIVRKIIFIRFLFVKKKPEQAVQNTYNTYVVWILIRYTPFICTTCNNDTESMKKLP